MLRAARLAAIVVLSTLLIGCGSGFLGFKIHTGTLSGAYADQLALNPEGRCTPQMMHVIWTDIRKSFYKATTDNQLFVSGLRALEKKTKKCIDIPNKPYSFSKFWLLLDSVEKQSPIGLSQLCYTAIHGIMKGLGDKYSHFYDVKQGKARYKSLIGGSYVGVGFSMTTDHTHKRLFVDHIYPSTSADGVLKKFDEILMVDKKYVKDIGVPKIVYHLRGKKGSAVRLLVKRPGKKKTKVWVFTRRKVERKGASCKIVSGIVYCRVLGFHPKTVKHLMDSYEELPKHSKKMILDLRNNPGGLLFSATNMASRWIGGKTSVVLMKRTHGAVTFNDMCCKPIFAKYKTVVLINKGSASSSELFAAALKDYKAATFIGQNTMGKGVAQKVRFVLGAVVSFTTMHFLSPHGHVIHKQGIAPDIYVKLTLKHIEAGNDTQLKRAIRYLKE